MEWKELVCINENFVNVFANKEGVIKTIDKKGREYFYKDRLSPDGYKRVVIKGKDFKQHRVIALAFIPNPEGKPEVNHINGIKNDNSVLNLEWATRKENSIHAYNTGLSKPMLGEKHGKSKLTLDQVLMIRESKESSTKLAPIFEVSPRLIRAIKAKERWKHV